MATQRPLFLRQIDTTLFGGHGTDAYVGEISDCFFL